MATPDLKLSSRGLPESYVGDAPIVKNQYGEYSRAGIPETYNIAQLPITKRIQLALSANTYGEAIKTILAKKPKLIGDIISEKSTLAKDINYVKRKINENIASKLSKKNINPSTENIQQYKQYASPLSNPNLQLGKVLGIKSQEQVVNEFGEVQEVRESQPTGVLSLNTPSLILIGATSSPSSLAKPITEPKVKLVGTIERKEGGSIINLIQRTEGSNQYGIGTVYVKDMGESTLQLGKGFRFEAESGYKLPNTKVVKLKNVNPEVTLGAGKEIGKATKIKEVGEIKYVREGQLNLGKNSKIVNEFNKKILEKNDAGIGSLVKGKVGDISKTKKGLRVDFGDTTDIFALASKKVEGADPFYEIVGGKPVVRIYKKGGIKYVVKNPSIKGKLYEVLPEEDSVIKFMQPSGTKKTPLELTFQEQQGVVVLSKALSKAKAPKISKGVKEISTGSTGLYTLYNTQSNGNIGYSSLSFRLSSWTDNLLSSIYTRGTFGRGFNKGSKFSASAEESTNVEYSPSTQSSIPLSTQSFRESEKTSSPQSVELKVIENLKEPIISTPKSGENLKEKLVQTPLLVQPQITQQKQKSIVYPTTNIPPTTNFRNKPKVEEIIIPETESKINNKRDTVIEGEFESFGRRKGIDRSLGKFQTEKKAKEALKEFQTKGLGASGFITQRGKRIKIDLGTGFRQSKVEPDRVVQKREFRLGTGSERSEIKQARRKVKWL